MQITTHESDGSDGYSAGTWYYLIRLGDVTFTDGGFASRGRAAAAARRRARGIEVSP